MQDDWWVNVTIVRVIFLDADSINRHPLQSYACLNPLHERFPLALIGHQHSKISFTDIMASWMADYTFTESKRPPLCKSKSFGNAKRSKKWA